MAGAYVPSDSMNTDNNFFIKMAIYYLKLYLELAKGGKMIWSTNLKYCRL